MEEVERLRELERKKQDFRRRVDAKRARMADMSPEEKDDFLFKLRQLRPDAADSFFHTGSEGNKEEESRQESKEYVKEDCKEDVEREMKEELEREIRRRRKEESRKYEEERKERIAKEQQWAEENLRPRVDIDEQRSQETNSQETPPDRWGMAQEGRADDFFTKDPGAGQDAPNFKTFAEKTWEANQAKYQHQRDRMKQKMENSKFSSKDKNRNQRSAKYDVNFRKELGWMNRLMAVLMVALAYLLYDEYKDISNR